MVIIMGGNTCRALLGLGAVWMPYTPLVQLTYCFLSGIDDLRKF